MLVLWGLAVLVFQCQCDESHETGRSIISVDGLVQKWWDVFNIEKKTTTSNPYDCYAGDAAEWPQVRRRWCCENLGLGCPSLDMPELPSAYMCSVGDPDNDWSHDQREWCCRYDRRGCKGGDASDESATLTRASTTEQMERTTTPQLTSSSTTGTKRGTNTAFVSSSSSSSSTTSHLRSTSTTTRLNGTSFTATDALMVVRDVSTNRQHLATSGNTSTQELRASTATVTETTHTTTVSVQQSTPTDAPYNCEVGFEDWAAKWSHGKQKWCCQSFGLACIAMVSSTKAAVQHSVTSTPTTISSTTTSSSTTTGLYDCSDEFFNWRQAWSAEKKQWCCINALRGCPYDCIEDTLAVHLWSNEKRQWCCAFQEHGCPTVDTPTLPALPTVAMPVLATLAPPPPPVYMDAFERVNVRESHQRSYFSATAMTSAFAIAFGAALIGFILFQLVGAKCWQRRRDAGYREMLDLDSTAFMCPE